MTGRRVFVRGVGAFTPLGATWIETAGRLAAGESAVRPVAHLDASGFPSRVAAVAPLPFSPESDRRLDLALPAAREAWAQGAVTAAPERLGIFVGAEPGRPSFPAIVAMARAAGGGPRFDHAAFGASASPLAARASSASPSAVASALAREYGARGPCGTVSLACASGAAAIAEAVRAIRSGECDVAVCGGVGSDVDPVLLAGFGLLGALSQRGVSCPFDRRRDGFVLGEGAGMLVLSCEAAPGAAEILGVGRTLDGHHLTAPDPEGRGAERALRLALEDAGFASVGYVQAHGTSTPLNDAVEAAVLRRVLGRSLEGARVASVKGALGHAIAGAGALGVLCAVEAVTRGRLLPTAGLTDPDPACDLPHLTGRAEVRRVDAALADAFAFGGANCCLVVGRV